MFLFTLAAGVLFLLEPLSAPLRIVQLVVCLSFAAYLSTRARRKTKR